LAYAIWTERPESASSYEVNDHASVSFGGATAGPEYESARSTGRKLNLTQLAFVEDERGRVAGRQGYKAVGSQCGMDWIILDCIGEDEEKSRKSIVD
jgi:hypothetical protein